MAYPPVTEVLRRLDGAARARDLIGLCGLRAFRGAVRTGEIHRVARGRYALPECEDPWLTALRLSAVVSHQSAASLWDMDLLSWPTAPHVTVKRGRHGVPARGAILHWTALRPCDLARDGRITSPLRTVLDCARTLPFAQGLAIADSALRAGLVLPEELRSAAGAVGGWGSARARRVAVAADGRAASALESALRASVLTAGLIDFVPQLVIRDKSFFARVDLGDPGARVVAEADSFEHHGHRAALVRDCRRYDELTVRGWLVLRFAWEHVMFEPDWTVAMVRAAVRTRPTRGLDARVRGATSRDGAVVPSRRTA